ncbi:type IV pili biogenesis protein [Pseudomonas sp. AFG_SD02_1510_Pfu_092]|uniref:pilus assembly protein PilP n=1 Tax=Pseudomonas sp. AFG_SD02_1510_Pfu_092 TaxID=2259497 RepID=UPI000DEFC31E|nr:pilus assembly protein PilP [Pseudomonas sp. AFG_SD02_1510_Pfu_092]RCL28167.1 type IV pili biogenesis protein [Pseudomonas sp. AFG_SD02_1510_Pfu_092]
MNAAQVLGWLAMAERSSRFRQLAPVLVTVAVFGMGCALRLPAVWQQQALEQARHTELNAQQAARAAQQVELEQLRASVAVAGQRLQEAYWHLAAGESMSDLVDRLAVSGHAHGLLIERFDVLEEEQQTGFRKVPLALQVVGRYAALRQWLGDWLGQARVLRSGDLQLAASDAQPGLLRLRLRVDAYQALAPTPAAAVLAHMPARAVTAAPTTDPFAPGTARMTGNGLVSVPLAQLEMVGSLSRGVTHEALLMAAGRLYRVRAGDRVGRDQGVVARVDHGQVEVRERLFMAGAWHDRTAFITLAKPLGKEAPDQDETNEEMGAGSPVADPAGLSDALSG